MNRDEREGDDLWGKVQFEKDQLDVQQGEGSFNTLIDTETPRRGASANHKV